MLTTEDYRRLADRSARLAIACPAPSVAEALMALALDYMAQAARLIDPNAVSVSKNPRRLKMFSLFMIRLLRSLFTGFVIQSGFLT